MGVNNRQRRRAKQKRGRRAESARRAPRPTLTSSGRERRSRLDDQMVRDLVLAAAVAFRFEPRVVYESRLEAVRGLDEAAGPGATARALAWWTERALDRAWESGWQPADVVRAVRRTLGATHAEVVAPAVVASAARRPEAGTDGRWADQVAAIGEDVSRSRCQAPNEDVALAVEAVSLLLHVPALPRLPGSSRAANEARPGRSAAMLQRVRALLAKAESTTFPAEAEALTAKAQELMARHAIDDAMLAARAGDGPADVVGWRIGLDDPYAAAKSQLLHRVAVANRARAVASLGMGFSTVFGTRSDLEIVELLFTSLLVQGTEAMLRAGRSVDRSGRSRTRSFRQSFLVAYAARIGERLDAATAAVVADGAQRHGEVLLPVLAGRAEAVEDAVRLAFPDLVHRGLTVSNYAGWAAGRAAADLASIAVGDALEPAGS